MVFAIGLREALCVKDMAILGHEDRSREEVELRFRLYDLIDLGDDSALSGICCERVSLRVDRRGLAPDGGTRGRGGDGDEGEQE